MKHAGTAVLDSVEALLGELRQMPGLTERSRGIFYRRSRAFLHFHEDPTGIFADVRFGNDFERMRVTSPEEQDVLLRRVRSEL